MVSPPSHVADDVSEQYRAGAWLFTTNLFDVYRGVDARLGRDVHLRFLKPRVARNPGASRAILATAKGAASLLHPNLVAVYDIGSIGGRIGIVTEAPGDRLADLGEPPAPEALRRLTCDWLRGLQAAHDAELYHGAIDDGTLFVGADGSGKLADTGLSPTAADALADVRALASTLLKRVTGRDRALEDALMRALSADPRERYESAAQMATAIAQLPAVEEIEEPAIPPLPVDPAAAPAKAVPSTKTEPARTRARQVALARSLAPFVLVVAIVAGLLVLAWNDTDADTPGRPTVQVEQTDLPAEIPR